MFVIVVMWDDNSPKHVFGCFMDYDEALRWTTHNLNNTRKFVIKKLTGI